MPKVLLSKPQLAPISSKLTISEAIFDDFGGFQVTISGKKVDDFNISQPPKRRTAHRISKVSSYQGRYYRTVGKAVNNKGVISPKKFLLGKDQAVAEKAAAKLELLWNCELKIYEQSLDIQSKGLTGDLTGSWNRIVNAEGEEAAMLRDQINTGQLRYLDLGPIWTTEALMIAEALRKGEKSIKVANGPALIERLTSLADDFGEVISFVPECEKRFSVEQVAWQRTAIHLASQAEQAASYAGTQIGKLTGQSLYSALDAYGKFMKAKPGDYGYKEAECAKRQKDAHNNIDLNDFNITALESMRDYWASRPNAKKTGKPIALTTVQNHMKTLRRFVKWLHRNETFQWTSPEYVEDSLRINTDRLRTPAERAALKNGIDLWSIDELSALYQSSQGLERMLLLLGLNCGFSHAEIISLRTDDLIKENGQAMLKVIRPKTSVYGEFLLWPETEKAINLHMANQPTTESEYLLLNQRGKTYTRQAISKKWNALISELQKKKPEFPHRPFKFLRKTAGDLIRQVSDGEVSGVFLCHGQAVKTDDLADFYTNRPFGKVRAAITEVRKKLEFLEGD